MNSRKKIGIFFLFTVVVLCATLFSGCGSAGKESAGSAVDTGGVQTIGVTECFNCHADSKNPASFPTVFGNSGVVNRTVIRNAEGWINGPHGNNESVDGNRVKYDNPGANTGYPYYGYSPTFDTCAGKCHDPFGEGKTISEFFSQTGITSLGMVNRPVIGCEACHGGGGNHFGLGPIPYTRPDADRCGQCHSSEFAHTSYYPEGDNIVEDYKASKHANSINSHNYVSGSMTDAQARCSRCHTDEGAKLYVPYSSGTMTYNDLITAMNGKPDVKNASNVQCRTCHDGHNPFLLLGEKDTIAPGSWSAEFKTCTACHQLLKADGTRNDEAYHSPYSAASVTVNAYGGIEEIIADTHFDDPATANIEGYILNPAGTHSAKAGNTNQGICRDCHNPHNADNTINNQWARSAHGGHILKVKEAAANAFSAAVGEAEGPAWVHYDVKISSREACQRCHTSTGFRNLMNSPTAYNPANNAFIATGNQKEMLYCWGCHTNNTGGLRNPGKFIVPGYVGGTATVTNGSNVVTGTGTNWTTGSFGNAAVGAVFRVQNELTSYIVTSVTSTTQVTLNTAYTGTYSAGASYEMTTYAMPSGRSITGLSGSFTCANCHIGRFTGDYIKNYPASINGVNFAAFNSHYLPAAGVLYRTIGYEYTGLDYANPANFAHDTIGVSASGTGTNGPCVECHMSTSESHLYQPATRDEATGDITAIVASSLCSNCHGSSMTTTVLSSGELQYEAALEALKVQLGVNGIYWGPGYPYYFSNAGLTTTYTAWPNKDTLGAAFNYNTLAHMPMAFVHNSSYTRRLIFDSIDWLDNGTLDGNITTSINGLSLTQQQKTDALAFLNNGSRP